MPEFKVILGYREFEKSSSYSDNDSCPLAIKLRSLFPDKQVWVGGFTVDIGSRRNIPIVSWRGSKHGIIDRDDEGNLINHLIESVHEGNSLEEKFEVTFSDFPQELLNELKLKENASV